MTSISTEQLHCWGNKLNQFLNVAYYSAVQCHEYIKQLHWLVIKFFALNFAFKTAELLHGKQVSAPTLKFLHNSRPNLQYSAMLLKLTMILRHCQYWIQTLLQQMQMTGCDHGRGRWAVTEEQLLVSLSADIWTQFRDTGHWPWRTDRSGHCNTCNTRVLLHVHSHNWEPLNTEVSVHSFQHF